LTKDFISLLQPIFIKNGMHKLLLYRLIKKEIESCKKSDLKTYTLINNKMPAGIGIINESSTLTSTG
jgi:hypothetical protein